MSEKVVFFRTGKKAPTPLQCLREAATSLARARAVAKEAHDRHRRDDLDDAGLPRHVEILALLQRSVEDALALAAVDTEDDLLQVALQQHEDALAAREELEDYSRQESKHVGELRLQISDFQRCISGDTVKHDRVSTSGVKRAMSVQEQVQVMSTMREMLKEEVESVSKTLDESLAKNQNLESTIGDMEQEHKDALAENARAGKTLGSHSCLQTFWEHKSSEVAMADEELAQAKADCEAEIERLEKEWAEQAENYRNHMSDLQKQTHNLQSLLDEKNSQARDVLKVQARDLSRRVQRADERLAMELQRMQEEQMDRANALRVKQVEAQLKVRDVTLQTKAHLEAQRANLRAAYRQKVKLEAAKCANSVEHARQEVSDAKREAKHWEKKVGRMREDYRGHAIKSGTYARTLDPRRRKNLSTLYTAYM